LINDDNGIAWINIEDAVRGLGFTQTRIKEYLTEISAPTYQVQPENDSIQENLPEYISEEKFYELALKGRSEKAKEFKKSVARLGQDNAS